MPLKPVKLCLVSLKSPAFHCQKAPKKRAEALVMTVNFCRQHLRPDKLMAGSGKQGEDRAI